jgi:hypothetical protein
MPISCCNNGNLAITEHKSEISISYDYSDWFWTDIDVLTSGDDDSVDQEMVVDESNNIHLIWADDTNDLEGSGNDRDVFYMNWNFATETWSSIEVISTEGTTNSDDGRIAIDSRGNIHVIWADYVDYLGSGLDRDVFHRMRSASGVWSSYTLISNNSDSLSQNLALVIDSQDNIFVAWSDPTDVGDFGGTDPDIFYNMYDENKGTWIGMSLVSEDSSFMSLTPSLAVDSKDYIHLTWIDDSDIYSAGPDYDVFYKKFSTSLTTWSSTQVVSTESTLEARYVEMCIDSEDSIHVVWHDETNYLDSGTDFDIFYKQYDSSISSWKSAEVLSIYSDAFSAIPHIAVDSSDTLHLVWEDQADYGGLGSDWDIVYQYKDKSSNLWSQLVPLSLGLDDTSFVPTILIDKLDHVHVMWIDRTDYLGADVDYDLFYRKFVGPPTATILTPFDSDTIEIGDLILTWQEIIGAENYRIYRDNSFISSTTSLSPIATVSDLRFTDSLESTGVYYYTIVASNRFDDSDLSNVESVTVIDSSQYKLFQSFSIGDILILAVIVSGLQLGVAAIVVVLYKVIPSRKPKT